MAQDAMTGVPREPGDVPLPGEAAPPALPTARAGGRSHAVFATTLVALLACAAAGITYVITRVDYAAALERTGDAARNPLRQLSEAEDFADLSEVSASAAAAKRDVQAEIDALGSATETERGRAALGYLSARLDVLAAVESAAALGPDRLARWPAVHEAIARAVEDLGLARAAAARQGLPPGAETPVDPALEGLASVARAAVMAEASTATRTMTRTLRGATLLSEVAGAGHGARRTARELGALAGLIRRVPEEAAGGELRGWVSAQAALAAEVAKLSTLTEVTLPEWESIRRQIEAAADESRVAGVAVTAGPGSRPEGDLSALLDELDGLVRGAETRLAAWRVEQDRVLAERRSLLDELAAYEHMVARQTDRYDALRLDLADFTARIEREDVIHAEGYAVLFRAAADRERVRLALADMTPPPALRIAHDDVVGVLEDAVRAVDAAVEGTLQDEYCMSGCSYADTSGWREFTSGSARVATLFDTVMQEWHGQVAQERTRLEGLAPPPRPAV